MIQLSIVVVQIALAATLHAQGSKPRAGTEALQGTWVITSINGQPMPAEAPEMTLTFAGDTYQQAIGGKVTERGTTKVDASTKPIAIDLLIGEGDDAGKIQLGIIEVADEEIRASLDIPNTKQRPTDLKPKEGVITFVGKKKKA